MAAIAELAAADAQLFWLSRVVPNDQFLLYGFRGRPAADALEEVRRRAEACPEFGVRVADDARWRYPRWEPAPVRDEQFVVHDTPVGPDDLSAVARLPQLDAARMAWRVHLFEPDVVVVQISHALGDGTRSSALAAALLGRRAGVAPVSAARRGNPVACFLAAARVHREPALHPPRPVCSVNAAPAGIPVLRTLLVERARLRGPTVTVAALTAIGAALGGYLAARGEDVSRLGAEVPVAGAPMILARNNFRNVGVGLYPYLDPDDRAARIAGDLVEQRRRGGLPAVRADAAALAATPAWLLRWGVGRFDPNARSSTVTGNTVVSSVNRGAADLGFGGCPVHYTAGFPALSPMQSLTHGVHGIGGTIALSVRADSVTVEVDDYLDRLAHALG